MGTNQDIMHGFVVHEIRRIFSNFDGWNITPSMQTKGYDTGFLAERRVDGKTESVRVLVSFEKKVSLDTLDLIKTTQIGPYGQIQISSVAIVLPVNADTTDIPNNVRIYFMQSFAFQGDALVWVKKPVLQTVKEKGQTAITVKK